MTLAKAKQWFRYALQFQPLKVNFIGLVVFYFLITWFIHQRNIETSSYIGLAILMGKIVLVFVLALVLLAMLSVFICFLWFGAKMNHSNQALLLTMDSSSENKNSRWLKTQLPFALRPFLGYVKVRLVYDGLHLTEAYFIRHRKKGQWFFFQPGLESDNQLYFPDIKEYHFNKAIVYFEDFLHLFSLPIPIRIQQQIQNQPIDFSATPDTPLPKKTEEEKIRIEQLRKVEGEFLNYKKFENSDDVRRIVWKIFAKNKELVVRIPEIMDPFSSHVYMYASFFHSEANATHSPFQRAMLNYYKNWVWTLYSQLEKRDIQIRYISDQPVTVTTGGVRSELTLFSWHQEKTLIDYFKPQHGSVLCIHSFTPLHELRSILSSTDKQTTIFFIRLSAAFRSYYLLHWFLRIFFFPKKDELTSLKNKWPIHPLKYQTLKAEQKIADLLRQEGCTFEIIS